jgi:hypothetical protein
MPGNLCMEAQLPDGTWRRIALQGPDKPVGTFSNNTENGREVIAFACVGDHSKVWRVAFGVDTEIGVGRWLDHITADTTQAIALLTTGSEPLVLRLHTDRGQRLTLRFSHVEDKVQ